MCEPVAPPHLLRGEDENAHVFILDRLATGLDCNAVACRAGGGKLHVELDKHHHQWDLPVDVDLHAPATAHLSQGKLTVTLPKKRIDESLEEQAKLRTQALADNRMLVVPVTAPPS